MKLDVGFGELITMEPGVDNSVEWHTATVNKYNEEPAENIKRNLWWKEENWPRLKKSLEIPSNPTVDGVCDEGSL